MVNLFAHRGFWDNEIIAQNSIASLKNGHFHKFYGIEFDVWFLENKLVLKHDQPENINSLVEFADYFEFGNDFKYWIDFKNLDGANAHQALSMVQSELQRLKIDPKHIFIAPFITNYSVAQKVFDAAKEIFGKNLKFAAVVEDQGQIADLLKFIRKNNIKFLSIFYKLINKNLLKKLENIELFPWTINDLGEIDNLKRIGIRNFITDKITPKIYETHNPW